MASFPATTDPPLPYLRSLAIDIANTAATEAFGVDLYDWQQEILSHVFLNMLDDTPSSPMLLVRPTGGGKRMVRDVYASASTGKVVRSRVPLLSLSKDRTTKMYTKCQIDMVYMQPS